MRASEFNKILAWRDPNGELILAWRDTINNVTVALLENIFFIIFHV